MVVLYERVDMSNILSCFVVGRPNPQYGLPVASYMKLRPIYWDHENFNFRCGRCLLPCRLYEGIPEVVLFTVF